MPARRLASGTLVWVNPDGSVERDPALVDELIGEEAEALADARFCSLCDALGHGYPGGGPCPLEERGWMDADEDLRRYGSY